MEIPPRNFIGSRPFRFLIGPQKTTFYVHADLVKKQSDIFATLVGGPMVEAEENCALIEGVEEETFVRFIEFMYTNDYAVPNPDTDFTVIEEAPPPSQLPPPPLEEADDWPRDPYTVEDPVPEGLFKNKKMKKKSQEKIQATNANEWCEDAEAPLQVDGLGSGYYNRSGRRQDLWTIFKMKADQQNRPVWEPRQNVSSSEDYTQVFLCHAQMYVLSDRYSIGPLRELSMQKLRLTLSKYRLFEARISDIVELVRYTCDHTMDHEQGMDKLRSLVLNYVVCHIETIAKHSAFTEMVQERGVLGKDLVLKMLQRLD